MNTVLYQVVAFLIGLALLGLAAKMLDSYRKDLIKEKVKQEEIARIMEAAQVHIQLSDLWREEFERLASAVAAAISRPADDQARAATKIALRDAKARLENRVWQLRTSTSTGEFK